jgi:hypothetical protein
MPEVYFELFGEAFDPGAALEGSSLPEFARIHRKGKRTDRRPESVYETSGCQICVGGGDSEDLDEQIKDVLNFLRDEAEEIARLRRFPGVEVARLRFGDCWPENIAVHHVRLPSELLLACGELRLEIVLSQYLAEKF